jgi:soluble lytic murein transglycosylase-like protein
MTQQSPLSGVPGRTTIRRRPSVRAMLLQGAVALSALVGGVSISQLGGTPDQRTVAEALASRPVSAAAPFARATAEPTPEELADRFNRQGYAVTPELARVIASAAQRHGIGREVAFGLVRTESGFSNKATSRVGAIGLSQLMPRTARWIKPGTTVRQLRDPSHNVDVGFTYLRRLIDRYQGDVEMALLAYNRGPGTVDRIVRTGGNPDNGYAAAVLRDAPKNGI